MGTTIWATLEFLLPIPAWVFWSLLVVCWLVLVIARSWASLSEARRWYWIVLRGSVLMILAWILANPVDISSTELPPEPESVLILSDASRSLSIEARDREAMQWREEFKKQWNFPGTKLVDFQFGEELRPVEETGVLVADNHTRLIDALEQLPTRFQRNAPTGVVVISDGRETDPGSTKRWREVLTGYRKWGVPVHVVKVGKPGVGDIAIRNIVAPRTVPEQSRFPIQVTIRSLGYEGQRTEIQVKSQGKSEPIAVLPITLTDAEESFELVVDASLTGADLQVEVPILEGEVVRSNNRVPFRILPRKGKIRVIYMEGTTGGEYRFIRDALVEDPDIECLALELNHQYAATQSLRRVDAQHLGYPTTREELLSYDVVICSDISKSAFSLAQLEWTAELVGEHGGGFAMIGGNTSFGAGGWDSTIWDQLIPVDMTSGAVAGAGTMWNLSFRPLVPAEVETHPIWKIVDDPNENRRILDSIPLIYGSNRTDRLKPAAITLAVADPPIPEVGAMPIITAHRYGKGRTFAFSPDSTVDWGRDFERNWGENDNRYFRKFWRNVVRWLAEQSARKNLRLRIETNKLFYRPDDPVQVEAIAFDSEIKPTTSYQLMTRWLVEGRPLNDDKQAISPDPSSTSYRGEIKIPSQRKHILPAHFPKIIEDPESPLSPEVLTLEVQALNGEEEIAKVLVDVQILDDSREFADPRPDHGRLEELAQATGGVTLNTPREAARGFNIPTKSRGEISVTETPVWDRALFWAILLLLLSLEWVLRRRSGLA